MAKKKATPKMTTATEEKTSQARLELPSPDMERLRRAARSLGLSLSAFIRQAVLEKTVDTERRMGL
jgi:predicted DNA binding CopG/RHH family protein